ncbi:glycosyltransferase [Caryophanon latum]|uniref:Glycosyl transferase family 1 domain-containing protein n=1 Tax=Caryophanon latum TaxID=33977 RepID=A0A1C0YIY8_9BACL|nr:glycosyltransferase [Caryophanon latum]OCS87059.1 hypothetical protein A6K76_14090 [Caryophanon latum]
MSNCSKKRILHMGISDSIGGIETYVLNLLTGINKEKFQLEFIVSTSTDIHLINTLKQNGGILHYIVSRKENYIEHKKQLKNILQSNKFNIIHYHIINLSYLLPFKYINNNCEVILHSHTSKLTSNKRILFFHYVFKAIYMRREIHLLACSEFAGKVMFGEKQFTVIPNAIEFEKYEFNLAKRNEIRELFSLNDQIVLGHIGRLEAEKNHQYLIDLFEVLVKENQLPVHLIIIGEGSLKNHLISYVAEKKLDNKISFLGLRSDINELLNMIDIFLMPSKFEGLPFALIEAQVNGLKCIVSTGVSQESNINGNVKYLSLQSDFANWKDTIYQMSLNLDERNNDLKDSLYDIKKSSKIIEHIYEQLSTTIT